jgi:hypothetical protein
LFDYFDILETELEIYLKIFVMLYADDTILLAASAEDLQVQLNAFGEYCDNWKMKMNVNKTKIMVFGFGKLRQNLKFTYKNVDIEIVKQFNYYGVIFTKTCNFYVTKKHLADKALKAMYEVQYSPKAFNCTRRSSADSVNTIVSSAYNITNIFR